MKEQTPGEVKLKGYLDMIAAMHRNRDPLRHTGKKHGHCADNGVFPAVASGISRLRIRRLFVYLH
ncbi:MAG: hypothetical protein HFI55_05910 [Lachnospiraceae bacterium]|jgi:hypothetical protein|nr:hypothetical protein [Lachnospiraceae bacterium]